MDDLFFFQNIGEPSVCSEVKGEEDAVHCGIGTQSADSSDRGYYIVCSVHAFAGAFSLSILQASRFVFFFFLTIFVAFIHREI